MSATTDAPDTTRKPRILPSRRGLWLVAAAVAAGVVLFLLIWLGDRDTGPRQGADASSQAGREEAFTPLPAPPPAGSTAGSGLPETPAPPPASGPSSAEGTGRDAVPDAQQAPVTAAVELSASAPVAIEMPPPRYPARALRRGETGEVLLRVQVDPRGVPSSVDVASGSGSRDLDRAAVTAARRWRFRPAMRDGQPVAGVVNVPITFDSRR